MKSTSIAAVSVSVMTLLVVCGCQTEARRAVKLEGGVEPIESEVKPAEKKQDLVDRWHAFNEGRLTDLSLIERRDGTSARDHHGRPMNFSLSSFGTSRLALPDVTRDTEARKSIQAMFGEDEAGFVFLYGAKDKPLTMSSMERTPWRDLYNTKHFRGVVEKSVEPTAYEMAKKALATGKQVSNETKLFRTATRVIRLSKPECMNCHTGSKLNDPVAVMVYGIGSPKAIEAEKKRLSPASTPDRGSQTLTQNTTFRGPN